MSLAAKREAALKKRQEEVEKEKLEKEKKANERLQLLFAEDDDMPDVSSKDDKAAIQEKLMNNEYLGPKKERKKKPKKSERTRFVFEWDSNEDTSVDYNSLYSKKQEVKPQFGRGVIAGFDSDEKTEKERERELPPTHWSKKDLKGL
eukprot:gene18672-22338_t